MSFAAREESRASGAPITLYRFTVGDDIYAYTDFESPYEYDGVTYDPMAIDRDAVNTSGTLDKSTLKVRLPQNTEVAELFRLFPPSEVVGLTIFQAHVFDPECLAIWVGRVLSARWEGSETQLNCEPVNSSMRRSGLRMRDQYQCMHALYGPACKVSRPAFTTGGSVSAVSGSFVTLVPGWTGSIDADRFINGILSWSVGGRTEQRQILKVNAGLNRLQVGGSLRTLETGMTVEVSRGCSHNMSHCNEFGNIQNFGGCPWIPKKNPLGFVNNFY